MINWLFEGTQQNVVAEALMKLGVAIFLGYIIGCAIGAVIRTLNGIGSRNNKKNTRRW